MWEKKRNDETTQLDKKIQDVLTKKSEDEALKEQTALELEREREYLEIKWKQEKEKEDELERKWLMKIAQDEAAKYVQNKWVWYKEVGKKLRKKKKKRGKKKKKS